MDSNLWYRNTKARDFRSDLAITPYRAPLDSGNTRATESLQPPRWRCDRGSDAFDVREVDHAATDFPEFNFSAEHFGLPRL